MVKIENQVRLHKKSGFSLIELMIGIAIIGMLMASIIPFLREKEPGHGRKQFAARLNTIMQRAWQNAIITNAVHRIFFNFQERTAVIEKDVTPSPTAKELSFERVTGVDTQMTWPSTFVIQQLIVEGFDEMRRVKGGSATVWFYLIPDGLTQEVTINGVDKDDIIAGKPSRFGLVLNPYTAQFKVHDAFQK